MRDRTRGMSFEEFYAGLDKRRGDPPAVSPYGVPGINSAEDANIILSGMGRGPRVAPVEVTPPARVAEVRSWARTDLPSLALAVVKPTRRRLSKAERLERKAAKLRAEIERLRK